MYAGRGRGGVMTKAYGCVQGEGVQIWRVGIRISTVYFPFLKMFLIKKKNENDWGDGGFADVTSEWLNFEQKIAPGIK